MAVLEVETTTDFWYTIPHYTYIDYNCPIRGARQKSNTTIGGDPENNCGHCTQRGTASGVIERFKFFGSTVHHPNV
jgi:hypothetical protein